MGNRIGKILKNMAFWGLALLLVVCLMRLVQRKDSPEKNSDFFREADRIDVLFIGSSHVINGIDPLQLYEEQGITSYNLGGHGSQIPESYWELRNALDYCSPKVVVIDAYMLERTEEKVDDRSDPETAVSQLHLNMDAFPLSLTKIEAVNDLIRSGQTRKEFLVPFLVYHDRWKELDRNDWLSVIGKGTTGSNMGGEVRTQVERQLRAKLTGTEEIPAFPVGNTGETYLRKMLDLCSGKGIQAVVTFFPFNEQVEDVSAALRAEEIAEEYAVPFLDMRGDDNVIDYETDLNDNGHLNLSGMRRVTGTVGAFLAGTGISEDHRSDGTGTVYEEKLAREKEELGERLLEGNDLYEELLLLSEESQDYDLALYIRDGSPLLQDETVFSLIRKMTGTDVIGAASVQGPYFLLRDLHYQLNYEMNGLNPVDGMGTGFGAVSYYPVSSYAFLTEESDPDTNLLDPGEQLADMQILLLDPETGEIVRHFCYCEDKNSYSLN